MKLTLIILVLTTILSIPSGCKSRKIIETSAASAHRDTSENSTHTFIEKVNTVDCADSSRLIIMDSVSITITRDDMSENHTHIAAKRITLSQNITNSTETDRTTLDSSYTDIHASSDSFSNREVTRKYYQHSSPIAIFTIMATLATITSILLYRRRRR